MNVFYFVSDLFVSVAATSIVSLLENNKSSGMIHIFIADDGVKIESKEKLKNMVRKYNADILFISVPDPSVLLDFPFKDRYQIGHSYPRMCIARLLPESVEKVLILDSDTLIVDDLGELWNLEMDGNILAGVADCLNLKAFNRQFSLDPGQFYCNAGVFLVDLKKWREQKIEELIIQTIREHNGNIFFFEQTLMNYCCKGEILKLPVEYNLYTLFYAFEYENLIRWRHPTVFYSDEEIQKAVKHPRIIHFTRNFYMKSHPWKEGSEHPMTQVYRKYMKITPWKNLCKDNKTKKQEWWYRLWHKVPQRVLCQSANIIYNYVRPLMIWRNE